LNTPRHGLEDLPERRKAAQPGGMEGQGYWIAPDSDEPVDELFDVLRETSKKSAGNSAS
jgi:hypothetical protein